MIDTAGHPLAGIRVLDLSQALAGPYTTLLLADAGADVIKIERPDHGDVTRGWGPPFAEPVVDGAARESGYFMSVNRGKRSVELNLKDPGAIARLKELVADADVLVENFRPGVMVGLGLAPETLMALNPRLVGCSISAFGDGGPDGARAGFDQILQGESGLMSVTGEGGGEPVKYGVPIADMLAGTFGAHGILAALYERERTGMGQWVSTNLFESMIAIHAMQGARWLVGGMEPTAAGNKHPTIAPYNTYACTDGALNLAVGSEGLWRAFAPLVGIDVDDARFATNPERVVNSVELDDLLSVVFGGDTVEHWMAVLTGAGIPAGRIRTISQVYESDQAKYLGVAPVFEHSTVGPVATPGPPLRYSRSARIAVLAPPALGEHNDDFGWAPR